MGGEESVYEPEPLVFEFVDDEIVECHQDVYDDVYEEVSDLPAKQASLVLPAGQYHVSLFGSPAVQVDSAHDKEMRRQEEARACQEFECMKGYIPGYKEWKQKADRAEAEERKRAEEVCYGNYLRRIDAVRNKNLDELTQLSYEVEEGEKQLEVNKVNPNDAAPLRNTDKLETIEEFELLNFLDCEDVEIMAAVADDTQEFLDAEVEVAADSGAGEHVLAIGDAPTYPMEESPGSRLNQHFVGAGGHRMRNEGQVRLNMRAANGRKGRDIRTTFQVAKVTRPLMSVSKICDAGMSMRFTATMAVIEDAQGKEVCRFIRKGGLYVASMKLRNPNFKPKPKDQGFGRRGTE